MTFPWLSLLGLLPLLGALVLALPVRGAARPIGLAFSLATLVLAAVVTVLYQGGTDLSERLP